MILTPRAPQQHPGMARRHVGMSSDPDDVAVLTMEEFLNLIPGNTPSPQVLDVFLQYRSHIDPMMPFFHQQLLKKGKRAKEKGWNVPLRYLNVAQPSLEEVKAIVSNLYRQMLSERYG